MAGRGERAAQYRTRSVTPYILGAPGNALKVLNGLPGSGETFCSGPSNPTCTYSVSVMLVPHSSSDQRLSLAPMPTRALTTVYASWCFSTSRSEPVLRSEEHTSELQSLMRISYAVFCLKKKKKKNKCNTQCTQVVNYIQM